MQTVPETMEGTWEEISAISDKFGNQRLRVTLLPAETSSPETGQILSFGSPAERAARLLQRLTDEAPRNDEEIEEAQKELDEFKTNMNEARLRSGAEPVF